MMVGYGAGIGRQVEFARTLRQDSIYITKIAQGAAVVGDIERLRTLQPLIFSFDFYLIAQAA